jgi:hypothetical protein
VRAMDRESERFVYLRQTFPKISKAKMKEWIFVGPQITRIFEEQDFSTKLNYRNKSLECIWKGLQKLSRQWKSGKLHWNCAELISSYSAMWRNISLKLHFLHYHTNFFPEYKAAVSDEHGKRFHPGISQIENGYGGKWSPYWLTTAGD